MLIDPLISALSIQRSTLHWSSGIGDLGEDGVDVSAHETRKIVGGSVQREDLSESGTGNRQVPAVA
jgi:hypothetical protein